MILSEMYPACSDSPRLLVAVTLSIAKMYNFFIIFPANDRMQLTGTASTSGVMQQILVDLS